MTCCRLCEQDEQVDEDGLCEGCYKEIEYQDDVEMENEAIERRFGNEFCN